jgi:P4 family phage/plasmid primase-like protien
MNRVLRSPQDLARQLGVKLTGAEVNGKPYTSGIPTRYEAVELARYPDIQAALDNDTGDRSGDTYRILGACLDAGLTFEEAQQVVLSRAELAQRLDERHDDDLARCWIKLVDKQQKQVQITGDPAFEPGHNPPDSGDVTHSAHLGMAIKMGKQFKGKLLYVNKIGWHYWDRKRYAADGNGAARRAVHSMIRRDRANCAKLPIEEREKRAKQIARYETASAITGILTEAAALEVFSVEVGDLDADPWLFNCANGTLDLRTMKLHDHDPADRITKVANAAYQPEAGAGTEWIRFLEKVLPDKDVRDFAQRLTSLSLLGEVNGDKQIAPIMTGSGANGKTTFIEAMSFPLGDYAATAEPTLLMAKRGDAHPTGVADLLGRRFVSVAETEQGRRFDIALLKWLTGGDTLKARYMRQDFFSFKPTHLLLMATNHLPRIDDDTEAVWRRIRVIPSPCKSPNRTATNASRTSCAPKPTRCSPGSSPAGRTTANAAASTSRPRCWWPPTTTRTTPTPSDDSSKTNAIPAVRNQPPPPRHSSLGGSAGRPRTVASR